MTDTVVAAAAPAPVAASPVAKKTSPTKKKTATAAKGKKTIALHPTTSVMVTSAIKELKEKKGSSLPAIKKYLAANYKVDPAKLAPFIRKFLKAAVANGTVVQTKGNGASGHFKLPLSEAKPKKVAVAKKKKSIVKKVKAPGTPKRKLAVTKKVKSGEPAAKKAKKAVVAPTKAKAAKKPKKAPAKAKKPTVVKPKAAPKVKKTPIKKTVAPKKK